MGTSEWDARAIIAYSQIHYQNKFNKKLKQINKWDEEKVDKYLSKRTFSLDSKKSCNITRKDINFKKNLIAANEVNQNIPDIYDLKGQDIVDKKVDLLTYSFPCQGLSTANMGRAQGISKSSNSTSNLIWQIKRILDEIKNKKDLPKYLLLENVKTLVGKTHKKDFETWIKYLENYGYKTYWAKLNGLNHRSIQKRERLFALSILNGGKYIKSIEEFEKLLNSKKYSQKLDEKNRKKINQKIFNSSTKEEMLNCTPNDTKSRIRMSKQSFDLDEQFKVKKYTLNTLTTRQDRHPNIGMLPVKKLPGKLNKRFITPKEAYQIMGFTIKDFESVNKKYQEKILTKESLYRQAGNSIIVSVLEDVFKLIKRENDE